MMKIPVEKLGLFEQLDRIVVAFFSKQQSSSPYDLNVSITQDHLDQKKARARTIRLSSCPTTIRNGFR